MARFYGSIQGNEGEVTRQGTANSGIGGHIRGWGIGAEIQCYVNDNGNDTVAIRLTSGSRGAKPSKLIGRFTEEDLT